MSWKTNRYIKKIAVVKLNKDNNFQVNLNSLDLGTWDKNKIDYYVTVNKMELSNYSGGYLLELKDIGVTDPVYKIEPSVIGGNMVKGELFYDTTTRDPNEKTVTLPKDVFMYRVFLSGNGGRHSIYLRIKIDGREVAYVRAYSRLVLSEVYFKDIDKEVRVSGRWDGYMSGGYRYAVWVYRIAKSFDNNAEYTVVFFERGDS